VHCNRLFAGWVAACAACGPDQAGRLLALPRWLAAGLIQKLHRNPLV